MITKATRELSKTFGGSFSEQIIRLAFMNAVPGIGVKRRTEIFIDSLYRIEAGDLIVCHTCGADSEGDVRPCANDCETHLCLGCDENAGHIVHEAEGFDDRVFCSVCAEPCTACLDDGGRPTGGGNMRGASLDSIASGEAWVACRKCEGTPGAVIRQRTMLTEVEP